MIGLRHPQAGVSRQAGLPFPGLLRLVQGLGQQRDRIVLIIEL